MSLNLQDLDCAICLQKCHHPTQLPCGHIFCFLCVKGVAIQNRKCAMCRADIPPDYLDHPVLLEKLPHQQLQEDISEDYQWYYEGRNGWWKYDERSNVELEAAYSAEEAQCALLLAGAVYTIDFQTMIQTRRNDPTRRRRVRRDTPTLPAKGIAGIKILSTASLEQTKPQTDDNSNEESNTNHNQASDINEVIEVEDDDSDDTNEVRDVSDSSVEILHEFSSLSLAGQERPTDIVSESQDDT